MIPKPTFSGTYDGKNIWSYKGTLDFRVEDLNERLEKVNELLNIVQEGDYNFSDDLFWQEVFDTGVCKANISTSDFLWSETNVAQTLEGIANYILAMDTKETKTNYKIYKDARKFNQALNREKRAIYNYGDELSYDEKVTFKILVPNGNYKLDPKTSINKSDLKRFKPLVDYQNYYDYLTLRIRDIDKRKELLEELHARGIDKYKNESSLRAFLVNASGEVKKDMLKTKELLEQPIKWKQPLKDSGCPSYDELDMFDKSHVRELLKVHRDMKTVDFQDDLSCIVFDLNCLIEKCKFTDGQREVLELYSKNLTLEAIGKELNITKQCVNQYLNAIVNRIIKEYENSYSDWYYLNICKGEYSYCKECGKVKLVRYFERNGKYYRPRCKECQYKK